MSPCDLLPSYFPCCAQASSVLAPVPPMPEEREMEMRRGGEGAAARWGEDDDDACACAGAAGMMIFRLVCVGKGETG